MRDALKRERPWLKGTLFRVRDPPLFGLLEKVRWTLPSVFQKIHYLVALEVHQDLSGDVAFPETEVSSTPNTRTSSASTRST